MTKYLRKYFSKNILSGFGAITYLSGLGSLIPIISVPIFLKVIGPHLYGEWILINSIVFYFTYSDFGLNRVLANSMTIDVSNGNIKRALINFQKALTFVLFISGLVIFLTLFLFYSNRLYFLIRSEFISFDSISQIFLFLILNAIITLNLTYIEAVYRSSDNFAFGTYIISTIQLISQLGLLIILYFSKNLVLSVFFMSIVSLTGYFIAVILLKKKCSWFEIRLKIPDKKFFKEFLNPSIAYLFYQIGNSINMQGLNIVVGIILGPITLSIFSTIRTMVNSVKQFINLISHTYWPEFSREFGKKDFSIAKKLLNQAFRINLYGTLILTIVLLLFGKEIYLVWTSHRLAFDDLFFYLLVISLFTYSFWNTNFYFLIASNNHSFTAVIFMFFSLTQLAISTYLLKVFGISLVPAITIITEILFCFVVFKQTAFVFNENTFSFVKSQFMKLFLKTAN